MEAKCEILPNLTNGRFKRQLAAILWGIVSIGTTVVEYLVMHGQQQQQFVLNDAVLQQIDSMREKLVL